MSEIVEEEIGGQDCPDVRNVDSIKEPTKMTHTVCQLLSDDEVMAVKLQERGCVSMIWLSYSEVCRKAKSRGIHVPIHKTVAYGNKLANENTCYCCLYCWLKEYPSP